MLMMPAVLCWVGACLPGKAADARFAGLVGLDVAVCIFRITADAHHDSGLVVLGVAACGFGIAADAHDVGLVVLGVAACVFERAADAHDASLVVLGGRLFVGKGG